ncbi:hypothetical protein V8G54_023309 [Vigna mungo]|uniref:Uncharacterized protein n=1 Tax=Vigna mungo TaxID=3915 RepID=A0AAQ3N565_VIGMU
MFNTVRACIYVCNICNVCDIPQQLIFRRRIFLGRPIIPQQPFQLLVHRGVEIREKVIRGIGSIETIIDPHENPAVFLRHNNMDTIFPCFPLSPLKILTLHRIIVLQTPLTAQIHTQILIMLLRRSHHPLRLFYHHSFDRGHYRVLPPRKSLRNRPLQNTNPPTLPRSHSQT